MGDCATLGIIADALQLKENISSDCCAWDLSKVACFGGRITQIDFRKLGLTGYIHPNISSLSELYILRLDRNDISGRLPNSLGLLDKLYTFGIAETKVEGEIPVEMASMNSLQSLDLTNTRISGLIPAALAQRRIAGLSSTCPYSDNLCLDSTTRPFGCDQIDFKCSTSS